MTEATLNNAMDMDSLLDGTLDDLADMPEFKPFPNGAHLVTINWEHKENDKKQKYIQLKLTAIETKELQNPEDTPLKSGDSTNLMFNFISKDGSPNEFAQGQFKEIIKALAPTFGPGSNRAIMTASEGATVVVATSIRKIKDKDTKEVKEYTQLDAMIVA